MLSKLMKGKSKEKEASVKEESLTPLAELLEKFKSSGESDGYVPPVEKTVVKIIANDLRQDSPELVLRSLQEPEARVKLTEKVLKDHSRHLKGSKEEKQTAADYVVREVVGTGVIELILQTPAITDVGWNGTHLSIQTNNEKALVPGEDLGITEDYINTVVSKYAVVNDKEFTGMAPIFDGMFTNIRISATHKDNSPVGATFSMRVTRPSLALNESNFDNFAPRYILELFEKIIITRGTLVISGETGTGKTELQKLLLSFVDPHDKIVMIEDVQETHIKTLFPDKDAYSWLVGRKATISDLVKACLRNNPRWIIVSETRGSEAYEMLQAVLSGHSIITTLHAVSAQAIPRRYVNMCKSGYDIDENSTEDDIYRYFDFGLHIKAITIDGQKIRYLHEMVEYHDGRNTKTIFKQKYEFGKRVYEHGELSDDFKARMAEKGLTFEFPEHVPMEGGL